MIVAYVKRSNRIAFQREESSGKVCCFCYYGDSRGQNSFVVQQQISDGGGDFTLVYSWSSNFVNFFLKKQVMDTKIKYFGNFLDVKMQNLGLVKE